MHAVEKIEGHLNPVTKIVSCSDNFYKGSFQKPFHKQWSSEADITEAGRHDDCTDLFRAPLTVCPHTSEVVQSLCNPSACIYIGI